MYAPITSIYLDVDEVLVDWVTPALRLLGYVPEDVHAQWAAMKPRPWNLFDVLDVSPITAWTTIDLAGARFWEGLPDFPWTDDLLSLCTATAETTLLTAPSSDPSSYAGKRQWMRRRFGDTFGGYALTREKHRFAHAGAVLIDDSPSNCSRFVSRGGRAILFPGVGNDLHYVPGDERVAYVREALDTIQARHA